MKNIHIKIYALVLVLAVIINLVYLKELEAVAHLLDKHSVPCKNVMWLSPEEVSQLMKELDGWLINSRGHLYKEYKFSDFASAMDFANKVSKIAEREYHHPNINISWGKCRLEIWTHSTNGLTENDFILAAKVDYEIK